MAISVPCKCENCSNPRLCTECGVALNPNFLEGCWEHFDNPACKFYGNWSEDMVGKRKSEAEEVRQ